MADDAADKKQALQLDFNALVLSLGSSAIVHLGEAPDPTTGQKSGKPDFGMAQQSIDLLAMLQEKTRGNLSADEQRLIENGITELRFRYVQVADERKRAGQSKSAAGEQKKEDKGPLIITPDGGKGSKTE